MIKASMNFPVTRGLLKPLPPEQRQDEDGGRYTKPEFIEAYGNDDGKVRWEKAGERLTWPTWALKLVEEGGLEEKILTVKEAIRGKYKNTIAAAS